MKISNPRRRALAVAALCIGLVVFSAFLPAGLSDTVFVTLAPLGLVVSAAGVTTIVRIALRSDEQPVALLSLTGFRAPPLQSSLI